MSKKLRCLELESDVITRLNKHNLVYCKDVLCRNYVELLNMLNVGCPTALDILRKASQASVPTHVTAWDLLKTRKNKTDSFLRTSLVLLDRVLRGGIAPSAITEIAGPSGCGKTQFCLMMTVNALASDDGCGVVYVDTESAFCAQRFVEIALARYPDKFATDDALKRMTSNVFVYTERTCDQFMKRLELLEENIITHKAKLIVIDSVASLVRKEFDTGLPKNMIERTKLLSKQAAILKFYAENYAIPVLVTNQVTTHFRNDRERNEQGTPDDESRLDDLAQDVDEGENGYVTVALGNTWSHCVNTRLIVQFAGGVQREILVAKSPLAPFVKFLFTIQESGFVIEDESADHYDGTDPGLQAIRVRSMTADGYVT